MVRLQKELLMLGQGRSRGIPGELEDEKASWALHFPDRLWSQEKEVPQRAEM